MLQGRIDRDLRLTNLTCGVKAALWIQHHSRVAVFEHLDGSLNILLTRCFRVVENLADQRVRPEGDLIARPHCFLNLAIERLTSQRRKFRLRTCSYYATD